MLRLTLATSFALASCASSSNESLVKTNSVTMHTFESDASGFNTKNFFYDNGEEVVVFDTQFTPAIAEQSLAFIRSKTSNPITHVVITHPNPDKFNGLSVFQKLGAKVIASEQTAQNMEEVHNYKKYFFVNMAKMFTNETYPALGKVDETFKSSFVIKLKNGETVKLIELGKPGVSTNQTVAIIPSQNSVVVGDLVHHKAHAWLEGGIVKGKATPTMNSWISNLENLASLTSDDTLVYGGRGEAAQAKVSIPEQIRYLKKADLLVAQYVSKIDKKELSTEKSAEHFAKLTKIFEQEFPTYGLSYMIQYGVYGLAASK